MAICQRFRDLSTVFGQFGVIIVQIQAGWTGTDLLGHSSLVSASHRHCLVILSVSAFSCVLVFGGFVLVWETYQMLQF